eukprot:6177221-Pleurochrysis_carterae.AAC.1
MAIGTAKEVGEIARRVEIPITTEMTKYEYWHTSHQASGMFWFRCVNAVRAREARATSLAQRTMALPAPAQRFDTRPPSPGALDDTGE